LFPFPFARQQLSPAQQVTLPLPRLLNSTPMGGQAEQRRGFADGRESGRGDRAIVFIAKLTAKPVTGVANKFIVSIAADAPVGVYDARVMSRLGVSSARAFSVNKLPEVTRTKLNSTLAAAMPLTVGSICNAAMTKRAVDFDSFQGSQGKAVAVDCAAVGIDSRLTPVVILADAKGADLLVNRTGG